MATCKDWELVGGDPAPGDPAAYTDLAGGFDATAHAAGEALRTLTALRDQLDDTVWRGEAADAFRQRIDELPPKLTKLHDSYEKASQAMGSYGTTLTDLQARAATAVGDAGHARRDETRAQAVMDQARAADPSGSTAAAQDAVEAARQRLRDARDQIDQIRQDRQGAETTAIAGLDQAGDLGIHNTPLFSRIGDVIADTVHTGLRLIADAAEVIAIGLAVLAVVVVIVAFLSNPGGWAALAAALSAGAPLFSWSLGFSASGLFFKGVSEALFDDEDVSWGGLGRDAAVLIASWGIGRALGVVHLQQFRSVTVEFAELATEVRPLARLAGPGGGLILAELRTSLRYVRVDLVLKTVRPANLNTLWDVGNTLHADLISKHPDEAPGAAQALGVRPPPSVVLAGSPDGRPSLTMVHQPIPSLAGAR